MSQNPDNNTASRRQFFKVAGLGAVAAGAGSITGAAPAKAAETTTSSAGYAETAHIKTYYALAK